MNTKNHYKIQDFQKIKILGQGTYGKCYLVNNLKQNQLCVLKQIQIGGMNHQQIQQTLKQARILEALDHPNIIKCIQAFIQDNILNIIMDYADGGDLSKKIKSAKGIYFNQNQVLNWFTQICLAIKHVHDRKIIHRDLKSQNIFLTSQNLVKLGDFGIAKPLQMTLQKIKTVVGTPYYMSPQICQNKQYSLKTDIWSLGVILYQICALKTPFDANSLPALALKITRGQYGTVPSHYSKQLKKLISDLLQIDPVKRPTINQVFKYGIIKCRIQNLLPMGIRQRQFSHTTLHSQNIFQRDNLKKDISKLAIDNPQINNIISPRNQYNKQKQLFNNNQSSQNKNVSINSNKLKDNNALHKQKNPFIKKKGEGRKRQISQPNLTPRNHNQKKMKSNVSLTNLQKKKSDKQKNYFKKKKNTQDLECHLSEIKQIRGQVVELHQQLSFRNPNKKQNNYEGKQKLINNFIKQESKQQIQSDSSQNDQSQTQIQCQSVIKVNILAQTLQNILLQILGEKQLSKRYSTIEQNHGFLPNSQSNQFQSSKGLLSLLYGINNFA